MKKINLKEKLSRIDRPWDPKIVAELNGQQVRLARIEREFVWHRHESADELFLVLDGSMEMQFRDRTVRLDEGEMIVVPRGVEHCPRAGRAAHVLLLDRADTVNTGDAEHGPTVSDPERI